MRFYITIVFILFSRLLWSQTNVDSIFLLAIQQSQAKNYTLSAQTALSALHADTNRVDIAVYLANIYAWNAQFDSSKQYIKYAYGRDNHNSELYDTWLNVLLWNKEFDALLSVADTAQQNSYSNRYNLMYKRLLACKEIQDCSRANRIYEDSANKQFVDSPAIRVLHDDIIGVCRKHTISAYYSASVFDGNNPPIQHFAFIDYSFKFNTNTIIPRLQYAYRNGSNDFLVECDYYRKTQSGYWYSNLGVGLKRLIFPHYRIGLEYYHSLSFCDVSLGGRFLRFSTGNTYIVTGLVGKFYRSYWTAIRPFIVFNDYGTAFSSVLTARKYGKHPSAYWELELLYGNTPSERYNWDLSGRYFMLNSYGVKFGRNWVLNATNELKCMLGLVREEFVVDMYRNRYVLEILYRHKL